MEYCLTAETFFPSFINAQKMLIQQITYLILSNSRKTANVFRHLPPTLFSKVIPLPGNADTQGISSDAACRTKINQQAERLLNEYGTSVLRLAYSYLHNTADAEEVLQDTLVQFLQTAPALHTKEHEKAWLLRVAANKSKNRIKYNTIRQTDPLTEELITENREDLSFVWEAVKSLPDKYREVIHLFYYEGYQTAQIAQILGMKETTVRSHLSRGRNKLKTILKEAYDFA